MGRPLVRGGGWRVLTAILMLWTWGLSEGSAMVIGDARLRTGQQVEIKLQSTHAPVRARKIQILAQAGEDANRDPAELVIRAPIDRISPAASSIGILGQTVRIDADTRVPSHIRALTDFHPGMWVKVYVRADENGQWRARRIRTGKVSPRSKIEGRIVAAWPDGARPDSISMLGMIIRVPGNAPVYDHEPTASEELFKSIVDARDPNHPAPWLSGDWLWSRGKAVLVQRVENDFTVGDSAGDHYREAEPQIKVAFSAQGPAGLTAYLKLRSRNTSVLNNAPLRVRNREKAIQLYEGFLLWRDILGAPAAIQIGRQDFDEYREWLFDDQLDAIRAYLYPLYPLVAEVAYINSLDNSTRNKFRTLQDYLLYVHGKIVPNGEVGFYRLWRTDSDTRGREPIWTGLRYRGRHGGIRPWLDASWLGGWDKGRHFEASALDLGATVVRRIGPVELSATAGHARASGNTANPKLTGIDERFEQTGYEDNTASFNGVTSFSYYGEIFDPELSNMSILTLATGVTLPRRASVDVIYHRYRQTEFSPGVARDLESTDLTLFDRGGRGIDPSKGRPTKKLDFYRDIGWELDFVAGITRIFGRTDVKWVVGFFSPGDALSPPWWETLPIFPKKRTAFYSQLNLAWQF